MYRLLQTEAFAAWLRNVRDMKARVAIGRRLERAQAGNLGDCKSVGGGVAEMRIDFGPGYRVYYTIRGKQLIIVLAGGDKSSQTADIAKAQRMAEEV